MKKVTICITTILFLVPGCKKATVEPGALQTIQVLEAFTEKPIAGATVTLVKCIERGLNFFCYRTAPYKTLVTNADGNVSYKTSEIIELAVVEHQNYWSIYSDRLYSSYTMDPKCTIIAAIKKVKSHTTDQVLTVIISDPNCTGYGCWLNKISVGQPTDTVLHIKGKGYRENSITWNINSLEYSIPAMFINGFDTIKVSIEY